MTPAHGESSNIFMDGYTWLIMSFVIFATIIYRFGVPAITKMLDKRIADIKNDIETAENLRIEAQEMLAQYQRKQRDAAIEAEKILSDAKDSARKIKAAAEQELMEVIARREKQLEERLNRMQQDAIEEIRVYAANLSMQAVELIVKDKLDKPTSTKLLSQSIASVDKNLH